MKLRQVQAILIFLLSRKAAKTIFSHFLSQADRGGRWTVEFVRLKDGFGRRTDQFLFEADGGGRRTGEFVRLKDGFGRRTGKISKKADGGRRRTKADEVLPASPDRYLILSTFSIRLKLWSDNSKIVRPWTKIGVHFHYGILPGYREFSWSIVSKTRIP